MMTVEQVAQAYATVARGATLSELDRLIALVEAERADLLSIKREVEATVPPPGRPPLGQAAPRRRDTANARDDLLLVERGVRREDGVTNPRLAARVRLPGLVELDRLVTRLRERRQERLRQASTTWPRRARYTGRAGKHQMNGRDVEPDEIVELSEHQYASWRDRFELLPAAT